MTACIGKQSVCCRHSWVMLLVALWPIQVSLANINLELRAVTPFVSVGSVVNIELLAISDDPAAVQTMSAADVIIGWDPAVLQLIGVDNTTSQPLLLSGFPPGDPFNLNEVVPPQDGDGIYQAFAFLGMPLTVSSNGTLLTILQFNAIAVSPLTSVSILQTAGNPPGQVRVFDGIIPNLDVTGTIMGTSVSITAAVSLGDMNCDGATNIQDIAPFVQALVDPVGYMNDFGGICDIALADFSGDGNSDGDDISGFINAVLSAS